MWVSPFRYLRIFVYLPLPAAFRSLSRLSSALSAKASTLRSYSLNLPFVPSVTLLGVAYVPIGLFFLCVYLYTRLGCLVYLTFCLQTFDT